MPMSSVRASVSCNGHQPDDLKGLPVVLDLALWHQVDHRLSVATLSAYPTSNTWPATRLIVITISISSITAPFADKCPIVEADRAFYPLLFFVNV